MKRYVFCIAIVAVIFGCNADKKEYASTESVAITEPSVMDSIAKIIKTADIRFRVKDVQKTKEDLSSILKKEGGTIAEFSTQSTIQESQKVKYSSDSLKEITSYRNDGMLIAKVPSEKLDDFINAAVKLSVFVDQQGMKMDDQSIAYLSNKLKAQNRVDAIQTIRKVATKKSANVESSLMIKDDYVDKLIENRYIDNQVKYSIITLNFYQPNTVKTMIIPNDNLYDYRPGFFQRLGINLADGWVYFKELVLVAANFWMFILAVGVIYFVIRYYTKKKTKGIAF